MDFFVNFELTQEILHFNHSTNIEILSIYSPKIGQFLIVYT